jgi:heme A synthase
LIGGLVAVLALLLLWAETRGERPRWARFLIPAFLLLSGLQAVFDPLLHGEAGPGGYELETAQHLVIGLVLLGIGSIEGLRAVGRLQHTVFAWALPAGIAYVGISLLLHAQRDADVPMILLVAQHRVHGATLLVAAVALALAALNRSASNPFRTAAFTALLLFGLEFMLYTEGSLLSGEPPAGHSGQNPAAVSDSQAEHLVP